jgi:hypothetical protein
MTGWWRRVLAASAVLGLTIIGAPPTAQAADCAGVTVVVDFRSLGGGVRTGCAPGDPSSGTAALTAAGFGYTFVTRQPGFVCKINDQPAGDSCNYTPPSDAHWSYWHGQPGGSWVYSNSSASAYNPAPGSVEGWSFGAGEPPGIAPPAPAPPPQPAPKPTQPAAQPPAPQPPAAQPGRPVQPGQPVTSGQSTQPGQSAPPQQSEATTTVETTAPASSETAASSSPATSSSTPVGETPVAVQPAAGTSSGGTVGLVIGLVVIAALGGLGVWTARRRAKAAE